MDLTIEREKIKLPAVPYRSVIGDSTGYVILSAFTRGSSFELRQAIRYLKDSVGVNQLVLDLRGNGGGLLQESISIVNLFVERGRSGKHPGKKEEWMKSYSTMAPPLVPDLPVAVLIDDSRPRLRNRLRHVAGPRPRHHRGQRVWKGPRANQAPRLRHQTQGNRAPNTTQRRPVHQRLDYGGEREEDGSARAFSDSTRQVFYTRNGRPVTDGAGVQPDVEVDVPS